MRMIDTGKISIARGRTAEILDWQDRQVLKLFYDWVPAGWAEREAQAARLVSATTLPTPKLLGELTLEGRPGLIYERVAGESLLKRLGSRPWRCARFAREFAGLQAAIHRQRGAGLPPYKEELAKTIRRLEGLPSGLQSAALDRLAGLPDGETLCHGDFHPDQVMVTAAGQVVMDWMTARAGQPAADVARTVTLLRFGPVLDASWLMRLLTNLLRGIFFRAYLRRYLELNPAVTAAAVDAWLPWPAWPKTSPARKSRSQPFSSKSCEAQEKDSPVLVTQSAYSNPGSNRIQLCLKLSKESRHVRPGPVSSR